jgi:hypothetical protein
MSNLFAAVDALGRQRFVGEVERGQSCACFCPECASPLVAKQGDENVWHFAHVAGQERPECSAGAANMMRRIAIDYLQSLTSISLPTYREQVLDVSGAGVRRSHASWPAGIAGALAWTGALGQKDAVATFQLDNGNSVRLLVAIGEHPPEMCAPPSPGDSTVVLWAAIPAPDKLTTRTLALQHLQANARFVWLHQADVHGLVASERAKLQRFVREDETRLQQQREQQLQAAGRRWMEKTNTASASRTAAGLEAAHASLTTAPQNDPSVVDYAWAPDRKPHTAFTYHKLRDDTAWIIYTRVDGQPAVVPWPSFDGWDEALPPSVGVADSDAGHYRAESLYGVLMFFRERTVATKTSSNPEDFLSA